MLLPPMTQQKLRIHAVSSVPRLGFTSHWQSTLEALIPLGISVHTRQGVFWGQVLERELDSCVANGVDWVLCLDYDSVFTLEHAKRLLAMFAVHSELDALAAAQANRVSGKVLASGRGGGGEHGLCKVDTAHFGLTLLRVEKLRKLTKPWFQGVPDSTGGWGKGHKDPDIAFWRKWGAAGNTLAVDTQCRIGHLELGVMGVDESGSVNMQTLAAWHQQERGAPLANGV